MGVSIPEAAKRLKSFKKYNKQLQIVDGINGSIILDDTWSITTTSLDAALKVLNEVKLRKKRIAVIGTITDLGLGAILFTKKLEKLFIKMGLMY